MKNPNPAPLFACLYPALAETARNNGYCLAIHGSVVTDLDLVAVPWVETACDVDTLFEAFKQVIGSTDYKDMLVRFGLPEHQAEQIAMRDKDAQGYTIKPHGRVARNLYLENGIKIDISVMPRINKVEN